jgi:uncharacterized protein (TIGR00255 family)
MTGFATVDGTTAAHRSFTLVVKSVNHRHLDLSIRLPNGLEALEAPIRAAVKASIHRGHVELTVVLERNSTAPAVAVDFAQLTAYAEAFQQAAKHLKVDQTPRLEDLFKMPGVVTTANPPVDFAAMQEPILAAVGPLLERFHAARIAEGATLAGELRAGMARLAACAAEARVLRANVAQAEYTKLATRITELLGGNEIPADRLLTEAALLAARSDVEEELVRLATHIARFSELLAAGGEVGRQLDFLLQELNREANTLLSKTGANSGDGGLRLTELGLAVKVELERAREQVQNLE